MALYYIAQAISDDRKTLITQLVCNLNGKPRIIEKKSELIAAELERKGLIEIRSRVDGQTVLRTFHAIIDKGSYKGVDPKTGDPVAFDITTIEHIEPPKD